MDHAGTAVAAQEDDHALLHAGAFMALFVVGLYASAIGPTLEFLARDLGVSLDTAGLILTTFFIGSISASAVVALRLHARDPRALGASGLAAVAAGALIIGWGQEWWLVLAGGAVMGMGDGLIVASMHILMTITSRDVASAINRLNLYFAFGAVAGPLWSGAVLALSDDRGIVFSGVAVTAAATLALLLSSSAPARQVTDRDEGSWWPPGNPTAWIMGGVLFLYVGAEFGLGSWVSAYARESTGSSVFGAAVLTAGYWAALMLGRIAAGAYYRRRTDSVLLLRIGIAGAGVASLLLALTTGSIIASAVFAFGAGLFLGPVWPATVSIASETSEAHATAATVTMGNAGGVVLPWLQGRVLVTAGPTQGIVVTAALCAMMFAIVSVFHVRRA